MYIQCLADTIAAESQMSKESMQGPVASHPPSPTFVRLASADGLRGPAVACAIHRHVICITSSGCACVPDERGGVAQRDNRPLRNSKKSLVPCAEASCWQGRPVRPQEYRAQVAKFAAYHQRHRRRLPFLVWRDASVPHFNTATGARCASFKSVHKCTYVHDL